MRSIKSGSLWVRKIKSHLLSKDNQVMDSSAPVSGKGHFTQGLFGGLSLIMYAPRGIGGGSSLLYISIAHYMQ